MPPVYPIAAFAHAAATRPEHPALAIGEAVWTYRAFAGQVGAIAERLRQHDLGQPPLVGVYTAQDAATYASLLAAHAVGAAYVPVNAKFPLERQVQVLQQAGLQVLLASTPVPVELRAALPDLQVLPTGDLHPAPLPPLPEYDPNRLAYLLFTSGSTGVPKGVPLTHGNLGTFLATMLDPAGPYDFRPDDRFLQMFELTFDLSVFSFFVPMCLGATCCPVPAEAAGVFGILDTLETQAVTVALLVPSTLAYLKPYLPDVELPALRWSLFCGEALPSSLAAAWQARIPQAFVENVYGPTEATIFCTRYRWDADASPAASHNGVVPIGWPLHQVDVEVWAPDAPHPSEGELLLGGAQVTPGYWQDPTKTAETFLEHNGQRWYRTGDLVRRTAAGELLYLGRADSQVKVDGYRVELGEIEHHARRLSGCDQVAAVALPTATGSTELHLWLEGHPAPTEELRADLATVLPSYMLPRTIRYLEVFPLNANGKIDRVALRQRVQAG